MIALSLFIGVINCPIETRNDTSDWSDAMVRYNCQTIGQLLTRVNGPLFLQQCKALQGTYLPACFHMLQLACHGLQTTPYLPYSKSSKCERATVIQMSLS